MAAEPDLRCYLVTGAGTPEHITKVAAAAARGGAGVIQVRSKPIDAGDLLELTVSVARAVAEANPVTRVLVDDRVDVAAAAMARGENVHGVHVGQTDLPVADVRRLLGKDAIIGLTTGTRELVEAANVHAAAGLIDYVGCGPYKPTPTKDSGRNPLGVEAYRELTELCEVPMVAIGSVTAEDAPALAATGVAGVAVVRALMNAEDPAGYAARIVAAFSPTGSPAGATAPGEANSNGNEEF